MADEKNWIREAMFYHIYPLGFTGAPLRNEGEATAGGRILEVLDWIEHFKELGINAIYFGPIFESVSHGYDTTDYYQTDSRLGRILRKSLRHYMKTASVLSWMESLIM